VIVCEGSGQWSIARYRVKARYGPAVHLVGECRSCGHFFVPNKSGRLRQHNADGCMPNLYRPGCPRNQRPERLEHVNPVLIIDDPVVQLCQMGTSIRRGLNYD